MKAVGRKKMIIGITGGIGTGKSTVLKILEEKYNFIIFEADKVAKEIMEKDGIAYKRIVNEFGVEILDSEGEIDKEKMSVKVFNNKENLEALNNIVHPSVIEEIENRISEYKKHGEENFVIEAALLIESGCNKICDKVWYIYSDEKTRIKRLMEGRNMNQNQIERVMKNQLNEEEFKAKTDALIDNSNSFDKTLEQIEKLLVF